MYYANGSYYDPEVGLHVDAMPVSSLIENAFKVFGLDLNGLMCDNILAYLPCVYSIFTTLELSPDPLYDPDANKSGWELFWKGVAEWFNGLSNEQKIGWGIVALLAACLVAAATSFATGGTSWAMLAAMARVLIDFAIGAVGTVAFTTAIVALSGGDIAEGFANATADAIFFGGIFSFISAGVTSGIRLSRYYSKGARALRYAQKGDYDKIAKMFTHNKHSKKVMLGKWDGGGSTSYVVRAGHDYTYYQMPAQVWDDLYKNGVDMWKINQTFLDQQIAAGKQFYTSHIVKGFEDGWFGREIDYLFSYNINPIYLPFGG